MVDGQNKEGTGTQATTSNSSDGNQSAGLSKIERAESVAKRLEETEKRIDEKLTKLQDLEVNQLLGSTAGGRIDKPQVVETAKDYANKVMSGAFNKK